MEYLINAYAYFRPGGQIMLLLLGTSLWMWALVFERMLAYRQMDRGDLDTMAAVGVLEGEGPAGADGGICRNMLRGFLSERTGDTDLDRCVLEQHAMRQRTDIRRFLPTIGVLAATAPLLGLLGTVTGMVSTFDVIAFFGTGNAKALSGGISKALVTTQSGLLVGVPGLFMSRLLARRAQTIERRLFETVIAIKRQV